MCRKITGGTCRCYHYSFSEHDAVVRAIEERDTSGAAEAMKRHLLSVEQHLSILREAAE